jgi:hypothetical protein
MRWLRPLPVLLALATCPSVASATGGVWCHQEDANMKFDFKAVMSRSGIGSWFDIEGRLETKFGNLPNHLAGFDIQDKNLTQRWLGREGILLQVQKYDAEPIAAVMLTLATKSVDEGLYEGEYELRVTVDGGNEPDTIRTGRITCGAD